jgi:hypothetical protein
MALYLRPVWIFHMSRCRLPNLFSKKVADNTQSLSIPAEMPALKKILDGCNTFVFQIILKVSMLLFILAKTKDASQDEFS